MEKVTLHDKTCRLFIPNEEIEKAIAFDNYMNAQEALDFGLVDEIVNMPL